MLVVGNEIKTIYAKIFTNSGFLNYTLLFLKYFSQDVPPPPNYGKAKTEITPQKKK